MEITVKFLTDLVLRSYARPREAARDVLALPTPPEVWRLALAATVSLSMLLTYLTVISSGSGAIEDMIGPFRHPVLATVLMGALIVVSASVLHRVGAMFGGSGTFEGALRMMVWQQAVMLPLQLVALIAMPLQGILLGPVSIALSLWLLTNFTTQLHGFKSLFSVFVIIIFTIFLLATAIAFVLTFLGVMPPPPELSNV